MNPARHYKNGSHVVRSVSRSARGTDGYVWVSSFIVLFCVIFHLDNNLAFLCFYTWVACLRELYIYWLNVFIRFSNTPCGSNLKQADIVTPVPDMIVSCHSRLM